MSDFFIRHWGGEPPERVNVDAWGGAGGQTIPDTEPQAWNDAKSYRMTPCWGDLPGWTTSS